MRTDALFRPPARGAALLVVIVLAVLSAATPSPAQETPGGFARPRAAPGAAVGGPGAEATIGPLTEPPTTDGAEGAAVPPVLPVAPVAPVPAVGAAPVAPTVPGIPQLPDLTKRENFSAAMQLIVLLTVLSLAPAILIMMTSFTRIIIVLSLLRQALGTQQLPPNQVLIGLSLFMTFIIMGPTWQRVNGEALGPYMDGRIGQQEALARAQVPVRDFMIAQIVRSGNDEDVDLFSRFNGEPPPANWEAVKTTTLIPAFMLSELKTAFLLGFKVYLPFLIIDMVISTVLISMGMMMLPPAMISLPFKLLLFVLVNGWHLITASLMGSFVT